MVAVKPDKGDAKAPPKPVDKVDPAKAGQGGVVAPDTAEQLLIQFFGQVQPPIKVNEDDLVAGDLLTLIAQQQPAAKPAAPTWEFKYYAPMPPLTLGSIEAAAAKYGPDGWEFAGSVKLTYLTDDDRKAIEAADVTQLKRFADALKLPGAGFMSLDVLVFKRQAKPVAQVAAPPRNRDTQMYRELMALRATEALAKAADPAEQAKRQKVRDLEAQLATIQKQLADLRVTHKKSAVLTHKELVPAVDFGQVMTALVALADARYGAEGRRQRLTFSQGRVGPKNETDGLTITGDPDAVDWVVGIAEKLKPATGDATKPPADEKK
jgi:hypothetical protein